MQLKNKSNYSALGFLLFPPLAGLAFPERENGVIKAGIVPELNSYKQNK
jgi:hypothetical protein